MPLYSYKCNNCGNEFEILIKSEDRDKEHICPKCGESNSKRIFTSFSTYTKSTSAPSCADGCSRG
mgnify:CR=1 FL=1